MSNTLSTTITPREKMLMEAAYKAGAEFAVCQRDSLGSIESHAKQYVENTEMRLRYPNAGQQRVGS